LLDQTIIVKTVRDQEVRVALHLDEMELEKWQRIRDKDEDKRGTDYLSVAII
jgi:hypothetical protein